MSSDLGSAIVPYRPTAIVPKKKIIRMVKTVSKGGRKSTTPKKRKAADEEHNNVQHEESPTSVVDDSRMLPGANNGPSVPTQPVGLFDCSESRQGEKELPQGKKGTTSETKQCFVVEVDGKKVIILESLEAAFAFRDAHGSGADSITAYDSVEKAQEAMIQKTQQNIGAPGHGASDGDGNVDGGVYDFSHIDESSANISAVADFRRQRDVGKYVALFSVSPLITIGNQKTVIVPFIILEDDDKTFWAFKASKVKEALEYLSTRIAAFSSLRDVVQSMRPYQLRDVPYGANVGRVNMGKKGSFPVESLAFIVNSSGKILHPHKEAREIANGLKQVFGSKLFRDVYVEMLRGGRTLNMAKSIEPENNHVWTIFQNLTVEVQVDVPLNTHMLDYDIKLMLSSAGVKGGSSQWSDEIKKTAFRDGVIPGDF